MKVDVNEFDSYVSKLETIIETITIFNNTVEDTLKIVEKWKDCKGGLSFNQLMIVSGLEEQFRKQYIKFKATL